jgi:transposase
LSQAKKARSKDILEKEVEKFLHRKHAQKWVTIQLEPCNFPIVSKAGKERIVQSFKLNYEINEANLRNIQRLYGITCFITNTPQESTPTREIIGWYRRKNKIEEAFHELKDHLDLRPVFLTRENRIKAHVTICFLAYFLYNDIEQRLAQANVSLSSEKALKILAKCLVNKIVFRQTGKAHLNITEQSDIQKTIIRALRCEQVIMPKEVKRVLKCIESSM